MLLAVLNSVNFNPVIECKEVRAQTFREQGLDQRKDNKIDGGGKHKVYSKTEWASSVFYYC